ncbi:MAG TPA: histidine kinase [Rubrivivax sp.]|nr:histidine kinase [Rubrivivax sp.]
MNAGAAPESLTPPPADPSAPPAGGADRRSAWQRALRRRGVRELLLLGALAALGLLLLLRSLALQPHLAALWRIDDGTHLQLVSSALPALRGLAGAHLQRIGSADGQWLQADASLLQRSPRWSVSDAARAQQRQVQQQLATMLRGGVLTLQFADGRQAAVQPEARGLRGLGPFIWLASAGSLALLLAAAAVLQQHPPLRNLPYAALALCQACSLLAIGVETLPGLGLPLAYLQHGQWARWALDLGSAAAMVQLAATQPLRLPAGRWIAAGVWVLCAGVATLAARQALAQAWWWTQAAMLGCGLLTLALMSWSYRLEPNPFALLMRRLAAAATGTLLLLSAAVAVSDWDGVVAPADAASGSTVWYLFMASMALLLPVFARAQPLMRELVLLSGACTVATSLLLLFTATLPLGSVAALSLATFFALIAYASTRRWLMQPLRGQHASGAERMFEQLYRVLRDVEARPHDSAELLTRLLRDLFEPLQVHGMAHAAQRSHVLGDGSALRVPLPAIGAEHDAGAGAGSLVLRFAERGRRMFTRDDARLADRVVEQLRRAVAYDKAVERGRSEERARIAQDLHDDIGARLLTLMYQASTPEMEDYLRHTLKDLKTLTRGLASTDQRLSYAAAEWKTDIGQRLAAARIELHWSFSCDTDIVLGVVQWSALTRVLRELVSNVIQHSGATQLQIVGALQFGGLHLSLIDDGRGRAPQAWSHGLGLGGVRKRVKLLGGEVHWQENGRIGIACTVHIPSLAARR